MNPRKILGAGLLALAFVNTAQAGDDKFVFAFPPREGEAKAVEVYQPIADYLSRVTGQKFQIRYTDNWLSYQSDMQKGLYDLVFDGPQFIGWRMAKQQHHPLARLESDLKFAVVKRKDNTSIKQIKDLAGHKVCGMSPPNLATLTLFEQFDNPVRQPYLMRSQSFKESFEDMVAGRCDAAVVQAAMVAKFDTKQQTETIFTSRPLPNQGFSAGPRIPPATQEQIMKALASADGQAAAAKLRSEYGNKKLVPASSYEYQGLGTLLKDVWGFNL
jgi:ABC-type phosphate/phosphonate transport system substrate-binding protein